MANIFIHTDEDPKTREEWDEVNRIYEEVSKLGKVFIVKNLEDLKKLEDLLDD